MAAETSLRPDAARAETDAARAETDAADSAREDAAVAVPVEVVTWVTKLVGGDGTGRRVLREPLPPRASVRSVLAGLTARYPELHAALWEGAGLGSHIEVLVNDAVLGVSHTLDSAIEAGDRITLLGQYMGGAPPSGTSPT